MAQDFCLPGRRGNGERMSRYVSLSATKRGDKRTSQMVHLFRAGLLVPPLEAQDVGNNVIAPGFAQNEGRHVFVHGMEDCSEAYSRYPG
jgi:hypothetical protein